MSRAEFCNLGKWEFRKLGAMILTLAFCSVSVALVAESFPDSNSSSQLPPGATQQKAAAACSSCHEARIIVQQRLSKAGWGKEVDKMIKWGAEVDPNDRDALVDYFSANFGPDRAAYVPARTAAASQLPAKGKTTHPKNE